MDIVELLIVGAFLVVILIPPVLFLARKWLDRDARKHRQWEEDSWEYLRSIGLRKPVKYPLLENTQKDELGFFYRHGEDYDIHGKCFLCKNEFDDGEPAYVDRMYKYADNDLIAPVSICLTCRRNKLVSDKL